MNPTLVLIMVFFLGITTGLMVAVPYSSMEYQAAIESCIKQYNGLAQRCSQTPNINLTLLKGLK